MKRIFPKVIAFLVILSIYGPGTLAQEESMGQLWFCWEATVNPAQLDEFIDLQLEIRKAHLKEAGLSYPISAWTDGLFTYYFFYPVDSYNDKDDIYNELGKAIELQGNDWLNRMFSTLDNHTTWFIRWDPELSYNPENPRLKDGEALFAIWDMWFVDPAKEAEYRQEAKKLIEMLKSTDFGDNVNLSIGDLGYEATAYLWTLYGKSPADLWAQNEVLWELLGEEGSQLFNGMRKYTKKRDFKQFWHMKELSYDPEE